MSLLKSYLLLELRSRATPSGATFSPNASFNGYRSGVREGLWFRQNVFGAITKAEEYHEGELQSVLHFWHNGLPRQRIFYKQGKPGRKQREYDKKGYLLNGMMPFGPLRRQKKAA